MRRSQPSPPRAFPLRALVAVPHLREAKRCLPESPPSAVTSPDWLPTSEKGQPIVEEVTLVEEFYDVLLRSKRSPSSDAAEKSLSEWNVSGETLSQWAQLGKKKLAEVRKATFKSGRDIVRRTTSLVWQALHLVFLGLWRRLTSAKTSSPSA